jgi:hypothetical protein
VIPDDAKQLVGLRGAAAAAGTAAPAQSCSSGRSFRSRRAAAAGTFTVDRTVRQAIDEASTKAADSHIETILEDLRQTVKQTRIAEGDISRIAAKKYPDVTAEQLKASVREAAKGGKSDSEIAQALCAEYEGAGIEDLLAGVREATFEGAEHDQLLTAIRQECAHISESRAGVIAKTETNRAFSMSQLQADRPFLDQNHTRARSETVTLRSAAGPSEALGV